MKKINQYVEPYLLLPSWKITSDFDQQNHLFSGIIETKYLLETYCCTCGHTEFVIKDPRDAHQYICRECNNEIFYDAHHALQNIYDFQLKNLDVEFPLEYEVFVDNAKVAARYFILLASEVDFLTQKVIYIKKPIYSLVLSSDGDVEELYEFEYDEKIFVELKGRLTDYLNETNHFNLPKPQNKRATLSYVIFFLKHRYLKDDEFYNWKNIGLIEPKEVDVKSAIAQISSYRKERSIKKAVYKNYEYQMNEFGRYDPFYTLVFTENFEDPNLVVEFLNLNISNNLHEEITRYEIEVFIKFLKSYYTQMQIYKLFIKELKHAEHSYLRDTVIEYCMTPETIERTFTKVKCTMKAIHDELLQCQTVDTYQAIFTCKLDYTEKELHVCADVEHCTVCLPHTGEELYNWGQTLQNCMASYFYMIQEKKTLIYCFFTEGRLAFAVEMKDGVIVQSSGKYNAVLTHDENKILKLWFKRFFSQQTEELVYVA